ncbi:MAG: hypothetical protein NUV35_04075 [Syntrophomonadaceae bacterium]|nr:hypothetical protein [Syntrophomonadaceae bacterium]
MLLHDPQRGWLRFARPLAVLQARTAAEVRPGDIITIRFGDRQHVVEVLDIKETVRAGDAHALYRVLE